MTCSYCMLSALQCSAIESWKAHRLRSLQQDKARSTPLESLDESSVLITQDWAMKWSPQRYREFQADWFGKRYILWHVSVVVSKLAGQLEQQIFVQILEESSEDADAVVRVIQHTQRSLKVEHPEITFAALRQDNAGCYKMVPQCDNAINMPPYRNSNWNPCQKGLPQ